MGLANLVVLAVVGVGMVVYRALPNLQLGIGTVLFTKSRPPVYQTSTHLVVTQAQSLGPQSYDDVLASEQLAATYSALLQSPPFLQGAITQLHAGPP